MPEFEFEIGAVEDKKLTFNSIYAWGRTFQIAVTGKFI